MPDMNITAMEERGRGKEPGWGTAMNRFGWRVYWDLDPPRWAKQGPAGFLRYVNFSEEKIYLLAQLLGAVLMGRMREYFGVLFGLRKERWEDW